MKALFCGICLLPTVLSTCFASCPDESTWNVLKESSAINHSSFLEPEARVLLMAEVGSSYGGSDASFFVFNFNGFMPCVSVERNPCDFVDRTTVNRTEPLADDNAWFAPLFPAFVMDGVDPGREGRDESHFGFNTCDSVGLDCVSAVDPVVNEMEQFSDDDAWFASLFPADNQTPAMSLEESGLMVQFLVFSASFHGTVLSSKSDTKYVFSPKHSNCIQILRDKLTLYLPYSSHGGSDASEFSFNFCQFCGLRRELDSLYPNLCHTRGTNPTYLGAAAPCKLSRDQEGGSIHVLNQDFEAKSIDYWRKRWLIRTTTRTRDNKMMYAVCRGSIDLFMKSIAPSRDTSFEYLRRYGLLILLAFVAILTRLRPTSFEYNHRAMKSILFLVFAAMLPPTMLACDDEYDSHSLYLDPFTLSDHYRIGASKIDLQSAFVFQSLSPNSVEKSLRIISLEESSIASSFVLHPETPFEMDSRASSPSERASRPSTDNAPQGPVSRPSTDHASKRTLLSTINARREMDHLNPNCHDNVIASCGLSQDQECDTTWINVPNQGIQHDDPATRDEWFGYLCYGLMILFSFLVILTRSTKSILFIVFAAILPPTAATIDATVSVNMDNSGTISLATDGVSFIQIGTVVDWHDTKTVVIQEVDITPSTIIQFECVDWGGIGGFIGNLNYNNNDYYTTDPLANSQFEIISSSDDVTSPLVYTANGAGAWGDAPSALPADAVWVWNDRANNNMTFHFSFASLVLPQQQHLRLTGSNVETDTQRYHFVQLSKNWTAANQYCADTFGTQLATIVTYADIQSVTHLLKEGDDHYNSAWIGLSQSAEDEPWTYEDGTPCQCYRGEGELSCDSIPLWTLDAPFDNVQASGDQPSPFSCAWLEYELTYGSLSIFNYDCISTLTQDMADGFLCNAVPYECSFIKRRDSNGLNFGSSNADCESTYGTQLATISSQSLQDDVTALCDDQCWIGLEYNSGTNQYEWQEGTLVDYVAWDANQPDNPGIENCVYLWGSDKKWSDTACGGTNVEWFCDIPRSITIYSCDDWSDPSYSGALQIQIHGTQKNTPILTVNRFSKLPTNGANTTFYLGREFAGIGDVYDVRLFVNDEDGYCIKRLTIDLDGRQTDIASEYFGNGVILSPKCSRSFIYVSDDYPLLPCITDSAFKLTSNRTRGVYNVSIRSCNIENAGTSFLNMRDSLYAVITGKESGSRSYSSTEIVYLDHYQPSGVNIDLLGELVSSNANITTSDHIYNFYSPKEGKFNGIKLEVVDYVNHRLSASDLDLRILIYEWNLYDTPTEYKTATGFVFDQGRYYVTKFEDAFNPTIDIDKEVGIYNYKSTKINFAVNIYFIFHNYNDTSSYQLPFIYETQQYTSLTWFEANEECNKNYGTSLGSLHSAGESMLVEVFYEEYDDYQYWIGFNDLKNEGTFEWVDQSAIDYINWAAPEYINFTRYDDCVQFAYLPEAGTGTGWTGKWADTACFYSLPAYICASPYWPPNTVRTFQINTNVDIAEVIALTIGNNHDDLMCIDSITINDESATYISDNWIGSKSRLSALFKYPVCATEVLAVKKVKGSAKPKSDTYGTKHESMMSCSNENRLISTTCGVSQSFEKTTVTGFTLSTSEGSGTHHSWGDATTLVTGKDTTASISNEFTLGGSLEKDLKVFGVGVKATLEISNTWISGTDTTTYNQNHEESFEEEGTTTEESTTEDNSWENSETHTVECNAEVQVPPSHTIDYTFTFDEYNVTIPIETTLKLSLCSAFLHPNRKEDASNYIYIYDIPGEITQHGTQTCTVQFGAAQYNEDGNAMSCTAEQKLAIATGATYIPLCDTSNGGDIYDGCQCEIVDTLTEAVCYCVDTTGNIKDGKVKVVEADWKTTCVDELQCSNSSVSTAQSNWFDHLNPDPISIKKDYPVDRDPDPVRLFSVFNVVFGAVSCGAIWFIVVMCQKLKNKYHFYQNAEMIMETDMDTDTGV